MLTAAAPAPARTPQHQPATAPPSLRRQTASPAEGTGRPGSAPGHSFARVAPFAVQAKLALSRPGDSFEVEADRTAERVMRMAAPPAPAAPASPSGPAVMRAPAPLPISRVDVAAVRRAAGGEEEQEEGRIEPSDLLSMKEVPGAAHHVPEGTAAEIGAMRGGGAPLGEPVRQFFEPRFGYDFSRVRVHTDARAARTARDIGARAYTAGSDIAFAPGEFRPGTHAGMALLAHELTHVVQQGDQVRAVMRVCDCTTIAGARAPTAAETSSLASPFPNLHAGDWCVTAPADPAYNCIAWSIGNSSSWIWDDVDKYGNNNGTVELSDFDAFYDNAGLRPVVGSTPANARVVLYADGSTPKHAAQKSSAACGFAFESKLGKSIRIVHEASQLEGGPVYGTINRFYVPK